jgi:hypothetical protein
LIELDHLIVVARSLAEGSAWVAARLGAAPVPGGKHAVFGTHNHLLSLDGRRFLEVLAVDPDAPPPARPRWFGLDTPAMGALIARGPALVHWAMRSDDIDAAVRDYPEKVEILDLARGDFRWRITVPRDGRLPCGGDCPTLLQWRQDLHPADRLPPSGCSLVTLGRDSGEARFATPLGRRTLPWSRVE